MAATATAKKKTTAKKGQNMAAKKTTAKKTTTKEVKNMPKKTTTTTAPKNTAVEEIELPERLVGKFTVKRGLTVRAELPEGATNIWRQLTKKQTQAVYDLIQRDDATEEKYGYLLDDIADGKSARMANRPGRPHGLLAEARKVAGF